MRQQDQLPRKPKQPQPPAVPFDPNNPSTWPKATPSDLAEMQAKAGYKPLTGKSTGTTIQPDTNMYNAGLMDVVRGTNNMVGKVGNFLVVEPAKSLGRTLSTQNIQTLFNPKSSWAERANALTEDVVNMASIVPSVRAGLGYVDDVMRNYALKKAIKNYVPEQLYEYGIHTSSNPNIKGFIDTDILKNRGGAGDALPGYAYQWRLSDPRTNPSIKELIKEGTKDAYWWSDRLERRQILDNDTITSYLTRANPKGIINDENLSRALVNGRNRGAAVPSKLEILDKATVGNMWNREDQKIYQQALQAMADKYKRKIAYNNRRLQAYYQQNPQELLP